jgi:glycosyltransferase involved in cell wall biosynthesis
VKILIVHKVVIPVFAYGGTERVIWDLGKGLVALGHEVSYLVPPGSRCDFAHIVPLDLKRPVLDQIPAGFDVVHMQFNPECEPDYPYLVTEHGNSKQAYPFPPNTVFLSQDHAQRYGASHFVHNGLDWSAYGDVSAFLDRPYKRDDAAYWHFLAKASWPVKNVAGAIQVAQRAGMRLQVMGGKRLNVSRGFRFTWSPRVQFHGMVGGQAKLDVLAGSNGLIFPVRWPEPFGLALIESLYFGNPVLGTPYGALREIVTPDVGLLSDQAPVLASALRAAAWDRRACHARAVQSFGHVLMARNYMQKYEQVCARQPLHAHQPTLHANGHQLLPWQAD